MTSRRILVGWDGSESANAALRKSVAYADEVRSEVRRSPSSRSVCLQRTATRLLSLNVVTCAKRLPPLFEHGSVRFHGILKATRPARTLAHFAHEHGFDYSGLRLLVGLREYLSHRSNWRDRVALSSSSPRPKRVWFDPRQSSRMFSIRSRRYRCAGKSSLCLGKHGVGYHLANTDRMAQRAGLPCRLAMA
jgi:hypothetical protein